MIHEQRWIPDTCANYSTGDSCSFLEEWDDTLDDISRVHTLKTVERQCSFHQGLAALETFTRVTDENHRKNTAFRMAKAIKASLEYPEMRWWFDATGLLTVDLAGYFTANQKSNLQAQADIQFGPGKVLVI